MEKRGTTQIHLGPSSAAPSPDKPRPTTKTNHADCGANAHTNMDSTLMVKPTSHTRARSNRSATAPAIGVRQLVTKMGANDTHAMLSSDVPKYSASDGSKIDKTEKLAVVVKAVRQMNAVVQPGSAKLQPLHIMGMILWFELAAWKPISCVSRSVWLVCKVDHVRVQSGFGFFTNHGKWHLFEIICN